MFYYAFDEGKPICCAKSCCEYVLHMQSFLQISPFYIYGASGIVFLIVSLLHVPITLFYIFLTLRLEGVVAVRILPLFYKLVALGMGMESHLLCTGRTYHYCTLCWCHLPLCHVLLHGL